MDFEETNREDDISPQQEPEGRENENMHRKVVSILDDSTWKNEIKTLVEFGCRKYGLYLYLKRYRPTLEKIAMVDINLERLNENLEKINTYPRRNKLEVTVYCGNVAEPDKRLMGTDVVVMLELIHKLPAYELHAFPFVIFGYIQPKIVIISTPIADMEGGRESQLRWQWSREQFSDWAQNIVARFPRYTVNIEYLAETLNPSDDMFCNTLLAVFVDEKRKKKNFYSTSSIINLVKCKYKALEERPQQAASCSCIRCHQYWSGVCRFERFRPSSEHIPATIADLSMPYVTVSEDVLPDVTVQNYLSKILERVSCIMTNESQRERFSDKAVQRVRIPLSFIMNNEFYDLFSINEAAQELCNIGYVIEDNHIIVDISTNTEKWTLPMTSTEENKISNTKNVESSLSEIREDSLGSITEISSDDVITSISSEDVPQTMDSVVKLSSEYVEDVPQTMDSVVKLSSKYAEDVPQTMDTIHVTSFSDYRVPTQSDESVNLSTQDETTDSSSSSPHLTPSYSQPSSSKKTGTKRRKDQEDLGKWVVTQKMKKMKVAPDSSSSSSSSSPPISTESYKKCMKASRPSLMLKSDKSKKRKRNCPPPSMRSRPFTEITGKETGSIESEAEELNLDEYNNPTSSLIILNEDSVLSSTSDEPPRKKMRRSSSDSKSDETKESSVEECEDNQDSDCGRDQSTLL